MSHNQVISDYMPLVKKEAHKWRNMFGSLYDKQDLISYGMEAVWKCSLPGKYKPNSGVTFGQYAKQAIRNSFGQLLIAAKRKDRLSANVFSLTVSGDQEDEVLDLDSNQINPVSHLDLYRSIDKLHENEKFVINKRFFEDNDGPEIAAMLGLSKERVGQIQASAMSSLKRKLNA